MKKKIRKPMKKDKMVELVLALIVGCDVGWDL